MAIPAGPAGSATGGPCLWTIDTTCVADWDTYSVAVQNAATAYATTVLWAATGRQFGLCEISVRPCGRYAPNCPSLWGYWWDVGSSTWFPYIDDFGIWRNCSCGMDRCGCRPKCEVWLPGPVDSVLEVIQDGVVVPPASYRVDNGRWLVRTDGDCWPDYADLDVDSGTGFFEVTYLRGTPVPLALQVAAGTLAGEWAKGCSGGTCRLPSRVTTIARAGVTVSMVDVDSLLDRGLTGLTEVDQIITAYNPWGLKKRPRVWSNELTPPRITTTA